MLINNQPHKTISFIDEDVSIEIIDQTNIIIKRPINKNLRGLEPKYFFEILGKKVKNSILKDHPIKKQSIYE